MTVDPTRNKNGEGLRPIEEARPITLLRADGNRAAGHQSWDAQPRVGADDHKLRPLAVPLLVAASIFGWGSQPTTLA